VLAEFALYGIDHFAALAVTAAIAALLVAWARGHRDSPATRYPAWFLAAVLLVSQAAEPFVRHSMGTLDWQRGLPLELCDLASFACVAALVTRRQFLFEMAYFWGLSGTLQALLTPALKAAFPQPEYFRFFAMHGAIVIAVLYLAPGLGMRPRRGAVWRVFGVTAAYAALVGLIDWVLGANYFFLCHKPEGSLLEWFGPWPLYILGGAVVAVAIFLLLDLPYRFSSLRRDSTTARR
jgi:hypothetical integral membrane protein (TIGR02206 family)